MRINKPMWVVPVAICLALAVVGCNSDKGADSDTPGGTDGGPTDPGVTSNGSDDPNQSTTPEVEPPPPATIPEVRLTDELRQTCILDVGQAMPEAELPGLDGQAHPLRPLYGEKLTVVCFWALGSTPTSRISASFMLEDLAKDVAQPYADKGVRVFAINEGDSAQDVGALATAVGADKVMSMPIFIDPGGALFAQVAHEKLPRIYVLDAEGKVLWFDMEYSEITREEMLQTIQVALGEI